MHVAFLGSQSFVIPRYIVHSKKVSKDKQVFFLISSSKFLALR